MSTVLIGTLLCLRLADPVGLVHTGPCPTMNGNAVLGFLERHIGKVGYTVAVTFGVGSGTLQLTGIPPGATIRKAFFYYHSWGFVGFPSTVRFNGVTVPVSLIGTQTGVGGSRVRFWSFRNDVTSLIPGNGSYTWQVSPGRGAALLVRYTDPSLIADYDMEVHDGANGGSTSDGVSCPFPNPTTFTGFTVDGTFPREAEVGYLVEGGAPNPFQDRYLFNGAVVSAPGQDPNNAATQQLEFDRIDVSSFFLGGETTATANICEFNDAVLWQLAVLRVRITPPVTDTTPPEIDIASRADGEVVASSPATVLACVRDESVTTITSSPPLTWSPSAFPGPTDGQTSASFSLVEGPNALTVTATDQYGHASSASVTVVLDTIFPLVTITSPSDGTVVGTPSVTLAADVVDATGTEVSSSPPGISALLAPGGGSPSGTVDLVEGPNTLSVTAEDAAGHISGTSITAVRDTIAPSLTIVSPAEGTVFGESPAVLTATVEDATATAVAFGGNGFTLPPGGGTVSGEVALQEGTNAILVTATDAAGNATTATLHIILDLTAPLVTIDSPTDGSCFGPGSSPIPVSATVDDLTATTVSSSPPGFSAALPAGGGIATGAVHLVEGSNTVTVSATDAAGRTGSASILVVLDTTPPTVAIASPADGAPVRGSIDFHAMAQDPPPGSGVSRVDLLVDGGLIASFNGPPYETALDTGALTDGLHTVSATAVDGKGNAATTAITVLVDNAAPTVSVTSPASGAVIGGTVAISAEASDAGSGVVRIEMLAGGLPPVADGSASYAPPVPSATVSGAEDTTRHADGPLVISVLARDAAGNVAQVSVTVTVDNTAPAKSLVSPVDGATVSGVLSIAAEASDPNLLSLEILVDGASLGVSPASPFIVSYDTRSRLDGTMVVTVTARDLAGNTTTCSARVTVDNLSFCFDPRTLNPGSRGGAQSVTAYVEGPNLGLLLPTEGHAIQLRVPGGSPVTATAGFAGDDAPGDADQDGLPDLTIKFDRQALIASIRAGIGGGFIQSGSDVTLTLAAEGDFAIGGDVVRLRGN